MVPIYILGVVHFGLLIAILIEIRKGFAKMDEKIAALIAEVEALTTVVDSAEALLTQLHDMLVAAQGNPAAIQGIIDMLSVQKTELADAVVANTPA